MYTSVADFITKFVMTCNYVTCHIVVLSSWMAFRSDQCSLKDVNKPVLYILKAKIAFI